MIMCKTYTKEDFDEDCPRFIPMKYESEIYENGESVSWYIFDTEKLLNRPPKVAITNTSGAAGIACWINNYFEKIGPYYDYQEAEKVCNIFNGVSDIFKGDVK